MFLSRRVSIGRQSLRVMLRISCIDALSQGSVLERSCVITKQIQNIWFEHKETTIDKASVTHRLLDKARHHAASNRGHHIHGRLNSATKVRHPWIGVETDEVGTYHIDTAVTIVKQRTLPNTAAQPPA